MEAEVPLWFQIVTKVVDQLPWIVAQIGAIFFAYKVPPKVK